MTAVVAGLIAVTAQSNPGRFNPHSLTDGDAKKALIPLSSPSYIFIKVSRSSLESIKPPNLPYADF